MARIEADHALLEKITDQMNKMNYAEMSEHLAGPIALLKYACTRTATMVADEACQIFGGRALTKTGMGRTIEMFMMSIESGLLCGRGINLVPVRFLRAFFVDVFGFAVIQDLQGALDLSRRFFFRMLTPRSSI